MSSRPDPDVVEGVARAIYACNPCIEQPVDLDGRPCGAAGEIRWDDLYEYDAGLYANMMDAARAAIAALPSPLVWRPTHRHVKRGTEYEVLGVAEFQLTLAARPNEGEQLTVYRGEDGKLWARVQWEFDDGRFEALPLVEGGGKCSAQSQPCGDPQEDCPQAQGSDGGGEP